jgi:hypothetical protein
LNQLESNDISRENLIKLFESIIDGNIEETKELLMKFFSNNSEALGNFINSCVNFINKNATTKGMLGEFKIPDECTKNLYKDPKYKTEVEKGIDSLIFELENNSVKNLANRLSKKMGLDESQLERLTDYLNKYINLIESMGISRNDAIKLYEYAIERETEKADQIFVKYSHIRNKNVFKEGLLNIMKECFTDMNRLGLTIENTEYIGNYIKAKEYLESFKDKDELTVNFKSNLF